MSLQGRVGVITGAGRGIGREIACALAADGMSLALIARTGPEIRDLADELTAAQPTAKYFPAAIDITDSAAVDRVVLHIEQHLGTVDLLVNNAGVIERDAVAFAESDLADVWRVVETNLRGPLVMTRALLAPMIARGHGHVVNITSRARAATRSGTYTGYAISKRALSVFTEIMGQQLAGTGVVAVDVLPGLVHTAMTASMPTWDDVTDWDDPRATASLVVDIAHGRYDDHAGTILDAVALSRR